EQLGRRFSALQPPGKVTMIDNAYDKRARVVLRKVRKALEGVAVPGTLPEASTDIDEETSALVKVIEGLQPKSGGRPQSPDVHSRPFNAIDCPVCDGEGKVDSRLPGRKKDCPRCLGRGWVRPGRDR